MWRILWDTVTNLILDILIQVTEIGFTSGPKGFYLVGRTTQPSVSVYSDREQGRRG